MDKNKIRAIRGLIVLGIILFAIVTHIPEIFNLLKSVYSMASPVLFGLIAAFILNAPISQFEKLYSKIKIKKKPISDRTVGFLALFTTFVLLVLVIISALVLIVPNIASSISSLIDIVKTNGPSWIEWLNEHGVNTTKIEESVTAVNLSQLTSSDGIISLVFSLASKTIGGLITFLVSFAIALYALVDKKNLRMWAHKTNIALLPPKIGEKVSDIFGRLQKSYSDFFAAQCIESCILGVLMFITLSIFRIPYAALIAVLTAIFAFVPYLGAWLACGVGCILMLVSDPNKIITCILVYAVTQWIENNFIYPHVVGNKVDLSPLVTLSSVVIGGSLFGVWGMIFFIPLMAVFRDLFTEYIDRKSKENSISLENQPENNKENHHNTSRGD